MYMSQIYELCCDSHVVEGAFFYDSDFGFYFITQKIKEEIANLEYVSLQIQNQMVVLGREKCNEYKVYKIRRGDAHIYAFALLKSINIPDVLYLSLDDLSISSTFKLFTGADVLEYLAEICKLPNGNYVCGSVQDYISTIEEVTSYYPHKEHFFRGHYYYKYDLIPSLYRKKKYYDNESSMYMDFKTQFYNELSDKKYIEILTTMQHYKMPTRLLDSTSNPLVALYMACDKPTSYKNKNYGIGEVIVMSEDVKNVKYSDSNAITLLSSLAVLETNYKQELYEKIIESQQKNDPEIYRSTPAYRRFVAEAHNELPYFDESFFTPEVLLKPRHVKVGMINERIIAQSGNFILFGLCNYQTGEYTKLDTVSKERIFVVHRDHISKQLQMLNMNEGTMYPDKDHISTAITKSYD